MNATPPRSSEGLYRFVAGTANALLYAAAVAWLALLGLVAMLALGRGPSEQVATTTWGTDRMAYVGLHDGVVNLGRIDGWETDSLTGSSYEWCVRSFAPISAFEYAKYRLTPDAGSVSGVRFNLGDVVGFTRVALFQGPWPNQTVLSIRLWLLLVLGGLWLAFAGRVACRPIRRWRRRRRGQCADCGYSLTGNVSGICPECGARTRASVPCDA